MKVVILERVEGTIPQFVNGELGIIHSLGLFVLEIGNCRPAKSEIEVGQKPLVIISSHDRSGLNLTCNVIVHQDNKAVWATCCLTSHQMLYFQDNRTLFEAPGDGSYDSMTISAIALDTTLAKEYTPLEQLILCQDLINSIFTINPTTKQAQEGHAKLFVYCAFYRLFTSTSMTLTSFVLISHILITVKEKNLFFVSLLQNKKSPIKDQMFSLLNQIKDLYFSEIRIIHNTTSLKLTFETGKVVFATVIYTPYNKLSPEIVKEAIPDIVEVSSRK